MRVRIGIRNGRRLGAAPLLAALVIAAFLGCGGTERHAAEIHWTTDLGAALERARAEDTPVMIDFMAVWCPPCKAMEDSTFSDPRVIEKASSFVTVRIDVDQQRDVAVAYNGNARKYGGVGIPNILFLSHDGEKLRHIVGYHDPDRLIAVMDSVLAVAGG